ncbi:MAG: arginyltransferase [Hyphomonadaceae bacterium]|nr:arginyltransferase [Hyphomonadaceae bacterium]
MKLNDSQTFPMGLNRNLRFFLTNPAPCPYLPGKRERKAFTSLAVADGNVLHNTLSQSGFRRSQGIAYRPACPACNACRSVRVDAQGFSFSRNQRRVLNRNMDLVRTPVQATPTRTQYRLLKTYLKGRHDGGGMSDMSYRDYVNMVADSPVHSLIFEYRLGDAPESPLVAAAITDVLRDGLSMVYTFFDPRQDRRSLGKMMILDHIRQVKALGLPHVYLGYWIKGSSKMDYKRDYTPLEVLEGESWRPLTDRE